MEATSPQQSLVEIGLSNDQAKVYQYLLENGALSASLLAKRLGITRTLVYKILDDLGKLNLVTKNEAYKVTRFAAEHPYALRTLAEQEKRAAEELAQKIESALTPLISTYNLQSHKPAVHHMEGLAGVSQALEDTLTATEVIYGYLDTDTVDAEMADVSVPYHKKRLKKQIHKQTLMPDTPAAREYVKHNQEEYSEVRLIKAETIPHFHSVLNIYDNKVSYITYQDNVFTSTIIHDPSIYTMQRFAFEAQWQCAFDPLAQE